MYVVVSFWLVLYILAPLFAKGDLTLSITKTENGIATSVESPLNVVSGTNFTLSCNLMDTETRKPIDDPTIVWSKKNHNSTFLNVREKQINLTFTRTVLENRGVYFCTSFSHNLTRLVNLVVSSQFFATSASTSRARAKSKRYIDHHADDLLTPFVDKDPKTGRDRHLDADLGENKSLKPLDDVEGGTHANSIATHHNGVPLNVLIGLGVGFLIALLLGLYRVLKSWRSGKLSMFRVRSHKTNSNVLNVPAPNFGGND